MLFLLLHVDNSLVVKRYKNELYELKKTKLNLKMRDLGLAR